MVMLNRQDAESLGIRSLSRIKVRSNGKELVAIVNLSDKIVKAGELGVSEEVRHVLKLKKLQSLEVEPAEWPRSLQYIKHKLKGRKLGYEELREIVEDVVKGKLSLAEIASFVSALEMWGLDLEEAAALTVAMVETGEQLKLDKPLIADKHSIGGCLGDKTSLLLVPTIAAAGITIPKTSSRAITSPAGTADRAEVLMPVSLDLEQMRSVVNRTNGCIVWGGALHLAPADDVFIKVEYPLGIDPLLFPSIMAKKKAVNTTHLLLDIPCGRGAKVKTLGDANLLAADFIKLARMLGMEARCAITHGEEPIGYGIGPALEAREALEALMRKRVASDLLDKTLDLGGMLLELVGKSNGRAIAEELWKSGKAELKLKQIVEAQGGDPELRPEDIELGKWTHEVKAQAEGYVLWLSNDSLTQLARALGSPKDKGAGIWLCRKVGDVVRRGEVLFKVYAEQRRKLERAKKLLESLPICGIGKKREMLIQVVKQIPTHRKAFVLER